MQKNNKKNANQKKNELKPVYKPYLRGTAFSKIAAKRGLHVLGYLLIFALLYVIVGAALHFDSLALRIALNAALLLGCGGVLYNEGARQGENDVAFAEIVHKRLEDGKNVPDSEKDMCYHPMKGFITALVGAAPMLVIALLFAVVATRQTYALGALPSWVAAYDGISEVSDALAYYNETIGMRLEDVLRIVVRVLVFPFVNMAGADNYDALYLLDKLSPLLCLVVPVFYGLGYLRGPHLRALIHGNIRMNRRRHNKNERKAREQRARKPEKKELI